MLIHDLCARGLRAPFCVPRFVCVIRVLFRSMISVPHGLRVSIYVSRDSCVAVICVYIDP